MSSKRKRLHSCHCGRIIPLRYLMCRRCSLEQRWQWALMSVACCMAGEHELGQIMAEASAMKPGSFISLGRFNALQDSFNAWKLSNEFHAVKEMV